MFDYFNEDGNLIEDGDLMSNEFVPGLVIGGFVVSLIAGILLGDEITPREYNAAVKVCEPNYGLKKIRSYLDSQTAICNNGAQFSQEYDLIQLGKL